MRRGWRSNPGANNRPTGTRSERMNAKVRDAQLQKVPYMLVVGDKEAAANAVSLRLRTNENIGSVPVEEFVAVAARRDRERSQELWPS